MTQLTTTEKTKIKFHYRQSGATTSALVRLRIDVFSVDWSSSELANIQSAIASCESAYAETTFDGGELMVVEEVEKDNSSEKESTVNFENVDYAITTTVRGGEKIETRKVRSSYQQRVTAYHREVEKLSRVLNVALW